MTVKKTDLKTRYEFLIAGLLVLVLGICAFAIYRVTKYTRANNQPEPIIADIGSDGTVLIEVEISQETQPTDESDQTTDPTDGNDTPELIPVNEHDNILIFITTPTGDNYYMSKEGRLTLYSEPKDVEIEDERPSLQEGRSFEVLGFSRDGWAAIRFGGQIYYVKSADIVKTDAPEDAADKHTDPENSQGIRYFVPVTGSDFEYVVTMNTRAYNLPDIESTGNTIDLKAGERVIVAAISGEWYKIVYMNAEYYVLSYLEPRDTWVESNPDEEIVDNTGYAPAGSPEAADAASSAGGDATPVTEEPAADTSSSGDSSDSYESYSGAPSYGQELLNLTNEARTAAGLAPLTWSSALGDCADIRAKELPLLTEDQNRNHERPDGSAWYTVNDGIMYAENIAYGQTSAQEVFNAWMNSPGHRDNIMNPGYRTFGAALYYTDGGYYYYWVQEFGY